MLQLFTVFVLVFPFTGASAHFPPARALKVRINRFFAHFRWPFGLKLRICSSFLQEGPKISPRLKTNNPVPLLECPGLF